MLPDRVSNPGPLTYESGALPIALRGPATVNGKRRRGGKTISKSRQGWTSPAQLGLLRTGQDGMGLM